MLLGLALLSFLAVPAQTPVTQTTTGWCSSNFYNVKGPIYITCTGVDPQAMMSLNAELRTKKLDLAAKMQEAEQWAARYRELKQQLEGNGDLLSKRAQKALRAGRLSEAESLLKKRLVQQERDLDSTAENHFSLGLTLELEYRGLEALSQFEQSYRYRQDNGKYGLAYASVLLDEKKFPEADVVLEKIVSSEKRPNGVEAHVLATTLSLLAQLRFQRNQLGDAENYYRQAIPLYRELAASKDIPDQLALAGNLSDLGIVYQREKRYPEALALHLDASAIITQLAEHDANQQANLAKIEDNLGIEYGSLGLFPQSQAMFQKALTTRQLLAARDNRQYDPDVARTLTNLGVMYLERRDYGAARGPLEASLALRREFAARDPQAYAPTVALSLNNLGIVYLNLGETALAQMTLDQALAAYKKLYEGDQLAYGRGVSDVLVTLSQLHASLGDLRTAIAEMEESTALLGQLAEVSPVPFRQMTAAALNALGDLYTKSGDAAKAADAYRRAAALEGPVLIRPASNSVNQLAAPQPITGAGPAQQLV